MSQLMTMTLIESTNISYISDRVACTVKLKLNINENFLENNGFLQMFI